MVDSLKKYFVSKPLIFISSFIVLSILFISLNLIYFFGASFLYDGFKHFFPEKKEKYITSLEASSFINKQVILTGIIYEIRELELGDYILFMDGYYPNHKAIVILLREVIAEENEYIKDLLICEGYRISVKGKLATTFDSPSIDIKSANQIILIDDNF